MSCVPSVAIKAGIGIVAYSLMRNSLAEAGLAARGRWRVLENNINNLGQLAKGSETTVPLMQPREFARSGDQVVRVVEVVFIQKTTEPF